MSIGRLGHVGVETGVKQAVQRLFHGRCRITDYCSSSISMTVLFTLIVVSIILGVTLHKDYIRIISPLVFHGQLITKTTVIVAILRTTLLRSCAVLVHFAMVSLETLP